MESIVSHTAEKVETAIMDHDAFKEGFEISAIEKGGVVTLRGSVPSKKYLDLAESIAQGVEGVASVINQMEVDSSLQENPDLLDLEDETQTPPARSGPYAKG